MTSVDLLLARHGATAWSRDDLFCGSSDVELSEEGRAMRFYEVAPFSVLITPDVIATAVETLAVVSSEAAEEE